MKKHLKMNKEIGMLLQKRANTSEVGIYMGKYTYMVRAKTPLLLPFNRMERNGSYRSRLVIFRYPFTIRFESILIDFHVLQSVLAHGSLMYIFTPVPSDSLVVLLYRSWLQHWIMLNFSITNEKA